MAQHIVPITNGVGNKELANATYDITSNVNGYDNTSINPASQEIVEGTNEYSFTVGATGTLTLHVSDDGTDIGNPIVGATFNRCDAMGTVYGDLITSDENGNAVFNFVPFAETNPPTIYYKQINSDGEHEFDDTLQNTTLINSTTTIEIMNTVAENRIFNLTDANYQNLPITDGEITLSN